MEKFWNTTSSFFASNPYVIGYDIINEPMAGDIYDHFWTYADPKRFEKEILQPFY